MTHKTAEEGLLKLDDLAAELRDSGWYGADDLPEVDEQPLSIDEALLKAGAQPRTEYNGLLLKNEAGTIWLVVDSYKEGASIMETSSPHSIGIG